MFLTFARLCVQKTERHSAVKWQQKKIFKINVQHWLPHFTLLREIFLICVLSRASSLITSRFFILHKCEFIASAFYFRWRCCCRLSRTYDFNFEMWEIELLVPLPPCYNRYSYKRKFVISFILCCLTFLSLSRSLSVHGRSTLNAAFCLSSFIFSSYFASLLVSDIQAIFYFFLIYRFVMPVSIQQRKSYHHINYWRMQSRNWCTSCDLCRKNLFCRIEKF